MNRVEDARAQASELGLSLRYDCDLTKLHPALSSKFVQLGVDESLSDYLERARALRHGSFVTWVHRNLRGLLSDFDINGLLGTYPMHVLGEQQWAHLLGKTHGRLLDVGAGNGDVTVQLSSLFDEVVTSEMARFMARRLRRRGFPCHELDLATAPVPDAPYDAITLLNVLDRCDEPLKLLASLRAGLRPGGLLVAALVLPYRPFVYAGGATRPPRERLPIVREDWEGATSELVTLVLEPLGLEVEAISRVPYLSGGDARAPIYELDDVIVVCRAANAVPLLAQT